MQITLALAALAAVAYAAPQGVTADIAPTTPSPAGCSPAFSGQFEITVVSTASARRDLSKRDSTCGTPGFLTLTLANGQLTDAEGRTGYIAANFQFQFDKPPQTGAIFTGGFSACSNGSLALGGSAIFFECQSGDFFNLYDRDWAPQCKAIFIDILPCGTSTTVVTQGSDGQPAGTTVLPPVTQITDGQPQAQTAVPVSEFHDGQPQVVTAMTQTPVTQISDGQVQAGTGAPVTQISDGQVQAPTSTAKGAPVTQISDGQVQAPTASPTTTGAPVIQISDGQVQATGTAPTATKNTTTTSSLAPFVGAGNSVNAGSGFAALVMGAVAAIFL